MCLRALANIIPPKAEYGIPIRPKLLISTNNIGNTMAVCYNSLSIFEAHKIKLYSRNN